MDKNPLLVSAILLGCSFQFCEASEPIAVPKGRKLCELRGKNPPSQAQISVRSSCSQIKATLQQKLMRKNSQTISEYLVSNFGTKKFDCFAEIGASGEIRSVSAPDSEHEAAAIELVKRCQPFENCLSGKYTIQFPSLKVSPRS